MKIFKITNDTIYFDNGFRIDSEHNQECCEDHYVDFSSIIGQGYEGKSFPTDINKLVRAVKGDSGDAYDGITFCQLVDNDGNVYVLNIYNSNNGYYGNTVLVNMRSSEGFVAAKIVQ